MIGTYEVVLPRSDLLGHNLWSDSASYAEDKSLSWTSHLPCPSLSLSLSSLIYKVWVTIFDWVAVLS